jgi:hypothetical protein
MSAHEAAARAAAAFTPPGVVSRTQLARLTVKLEAGESLIGMLISPRGVECVAKPAGSTCQLQAWKVRRQRREIQRPLGI